MQSETILITGANGFIGKRLVERFSKEQCKVLALIRNPNTDPHLEHENVHTIVGDILDIQSLHQIPQCDAVIHLAGTLNHTIGSDNMMNVNYQGTRNIIEFCRRMKVRKLIYLSTLAVMADGNPLIDITENDKPPEKQIGIYATSKAMAEKALFNSDKSDLEICIIRPPFVWGNGDNYSLPKLIESINKNIFSWIDNGNYLFSTCHVENLAEGLFLTYLHGKNKEVYFIQDKEQTTIKDFLTDLIKTQGVSVPKRNSSRKLVNFVCSLIELPWKILRLKSSPPTHLRETLALMGVQITIDSDKAEKELNYFPVINRETGIKKIATYCR